MSRIYTILALLLCSATFSVAQTTYTWIGGPVDDYQVAANWSPARVAPAATDILAFNAGSNIVVADVPTQTIGAISILSGTGTVTFTSNLANNVLTLTSNTPLVFTTAGGVIAGDLLTITLNSAAAFSMSSGTFGIAPSSGGKVIINSALTLSGGILDFDVAGSGGATVNGSIVYTSGTFNSSNITAITWANGSNYYHNVSGAAASAIPVSYWAPGSTCTVNGMNGGTVAPTGFTTVAFNNFVWNCPSQAGDVDFDFAGLPVNITGSLTVTNTGGGTNKLRITGAGISTINVGSYAQTNGWLVLQASTGATTLTVKGSFSHTGAGTIDFVGASGSGTATLNMQGSVTKGAGGPAWLSNTVSTAAQANIQFSGFVPQVVSISIGAGLDVNNGRLNIINTNTDLTGVSLTGTLKVINKNSAAPAVCINSGNFTGAGAIVYSGVGIGANNFTLEYSGSISQTASTVEFPLVTGPANLRINSSVGVSFPAAFSRTIPGTLTMTAGGLSIGANTLSLTNATLANQLVYTAGFITSGTLSRRYPTTGLPVNASTTDSRYPFGTGANDRSVNIFFSTAALTAGTGGDIAISHTAAVNASTVSPTFVDNGITIDRQTNSTWSFNTGAFDLGSGGTTVSITAQANNIGSVDNISTLRLIDATLGAGFGTLVATTGTTDAPLVGKSALVLSDFNTRTFSVGSDNTNVLQIVTFTWTGAVNTAWTNPANWSGGVGYPASPTEIAIINTVGGNMPVISTGQSVSVYQLTVTAPATLTMNGTASISVFDAVSFTGTAIFASSSTFTYASSVAAQNVLNLPYGTLGVSGSAAKILPGTTTVTGDFIISGAPPTFGAGTFIYANGTNAVQKIAAANYYNLTISGNRGGTIIRLGNGVSNNTIDVANVFSVTATNYAATVDAFNTFNFSSTGSQTIPGFTYGSITNITAGGATRILDPLGSSNAANVIICKALQPNAPYIPGNYTITGSKVTLNRNGVPGNTVLSGFYYNDFEITGNLGNNNISVASGATIGIAGSFTVSADHFKQPATTHLFNFNGTGAQTIPSFKTVTASNTPGWTFNNLQVSNGNRVITLTPADTINITGTFTVPSVASFSLPNTGGFVVAGSTVNFSVGSDVIPVLKPFSGSNNYNNITVTSGFRILAGNLTLAGNLNVIGTDAANAQLNIGNNTSNRTLTILGNLLVNGTSGSSALTSLIDFNSTSYTTAINLAGNLTISGAGKIATIEGSSNTTCGTILFNGTTQQYNNTSSNKNGFVNFTVGNGATATLLTLNNSLELNRSAIVPFSSTFTVANNGSLNTVLKNITIGSDDGNVGNNASFNLNAGATLITSNTGGAPNTAIEGPATDGATGAILAGTKITKSYNAGANYVLNGATVNPFPAAITNMANLTIGANVSLNRAIVASGTLDLASFTLTQATNNLQFSGLTSITGKIYADKNSSLSITGTVGTVGTLRFAAGGNTTGEFTINRPVTVVLGSDLTIDKTPLTGNLITGSASSILDINGNTLLINGAVSGPGTLSGSNTSNLTLGGAAGTINFTAGSSILKNLTLAGSATATLGTPLDITAGTGPGTEGTVSVTGAAILSSNGNLILKSGINGTSRVAQGATSGGYINGDVTVERYLPSVRAWRLLAAPTYGQTIKQSWQENQAAGVNPGTGYGTNITSNAAGWLANGFDFQTPGNSLLVYNSTSNGWVGVANTNVPITNAGTNKAYMLFSRGDRSVTPAAGAPSTPVLLRTKGTLFQGDQAAVPAVTAGEFVAVGNNFASAIDFAGLTNVNIDQSFSVWDPQIAGAQGLGAWVTFSASTAPAWVPIPGGGSYTSGVPNTRIESGQAFLVHSTAGAGSVTIKESSKTSGSRLVLRPSGIVGLKQSITTNLYNTSSGTPKIADANVVVFSTNYSNAIDKDDALKLNNFGDNFGVLREGKSLVVDARQPVVFTDTIFFDMKKIKQQSYMLEFVVENFDNTVEAFLEDRFLNNITNINMLGTTKVEFTVNADASSYANDRFRVVFIYQRPLPVTFTSVAAHAKLEGIAVEWTVENELNITGYEVEHSTDGINFTKVNLTPAAVQNSAGIKQYNWLDVNAAAGTNFYRIKSISNRGTYEYSRIVKVTAEDVIAGFTVYPNPIVDNSIGVQFTNLSAGVYNARLINNSGQVLYKTVIKHVGGNATKIITAPVVLASGAYQLELVGGGRNALLKVIVKAN